MRRSELEVAIGGSIFTILLGASLHFVYAWSNNSPIVALIAAVNESTWEHIKLGFWPLLIWSLIELYLFKIKRVNFIISKAVTFIVFCISIPAFFYSYTALLGKHYLLLDISIFIVSVLLGQYAGHSILKKNKKLGFERLGITVILVLLFAFLLFSFYVPKNFLFKDPISGGYGVQRSY